MVQNRASLNYSCLGRQRGATMIELTVVITLFLILAAVVSIGFIAWKHAGVPQNTITITGPSALDVAAWKEGANKAACLMNLSTIQKAVRGYQNMNNLVIGDPLTVDTLTKVGFWTSVPTCPAGGSYSFWGTVPAAGVPYTTCDIPGHAPPQTTKW
jgi:prepilin-type N-terminal cleavage/methylation domain-containing protein